MTPNRPLKGLVDFTQYFSYIPTAAILGLLILVAVLVTLAWSSAWAGLGFAFFALGDWVMLSALPRFARSYGPPQLPWLSLTVLRLVLALIATALPRPLAFYVAGMLLFATSLAATYGCWVEPTRLDVTQITLRSPRLNGCSPLRLLQISDLHVERFTAREHRLLSLVNELAPDMIVLTGDYLNISYTFDPTALRQTRELLSQLYAPAGVYAIKGSPSVDPPEVVGQLLDDLDVVWLRDEIASLAWQGCRVRIAGVECSYDIEADESKLRGLLDGRAGNGFTILLCHTPDVMPVAAEAGVDLYLAGHTHGGQLRLPLYGALVTASIYGKRYEMGAYKEGDTMLYVNRGVGLEGKGVPRARFLCPPEIVLFTLMGIESGRRT
jgi:predicted MPP superfamily phosphohydrolase